MVYVGHEETPLFKSLSNKKKSRDNNGSIAVAFADGLLQTWIRKSIKTFGYVYSNNDMFMTNATFKNISKPYIGFISNTKLYLKNAF